MNSSFYNGVAGIKSQQYGIDVIGNNIANINTTGFKGSTLEFSSIFSTTLSGAYATSDISYGSQAQTTKIDMSQGVLQNTDKTFDLALGDEGWFGVLGSDNTQYYTRAGNFTLDSDNNMVDGNGNYLLATLGNNITPTTLDAETLNEFGQYYTNGASSMSLATAYAVSQLDDIPLGSVENQEIINLPSLLYYPPTPTSEVSYGANLDPSINIDEISIDLDSSDYPATVTASTANTVSLSGSVANTTDALSPKEDDLISITLTDVNGVKETVNTKLDASLQWSIVGHDVSVLDLSQPLTVSSATITTKQEIANEEHFQASIIGADGDKDILDMSFTKVIPQGTTGTQWNASVKILSYYEKYEGGTYDESQYYIDTTTNNVYEIIDEQTGVLSFGTAGELLSNSISTLNNSGTALTLDLGTINTFDGLISSTNIDKSNEVSANGVQKGLLDNYGIDGNGNIVAEFTNGKSSAIAKVAVYHFQNDQGLNSVSSNLYQETSNSGKAIFYTDENGNNFLGTSILSNTLEGSNISLATALTNLIITQKAFDANSKSITTSDEMIQNAINMKT